MLGRTAIILLVGLIAAGGVAGVMYMKQAQGAEANTTEQGGPQQGGGPKGQGPMGQGGAGAANGTTRAGQGGPAGSNGTCNTVGINNETIGRNIKWLFDNYDVFSYNLTVYPDNMTIVWIITAPNKTALETLVSHIMQMECIIENGGTPRPNDPLFQVDAQISREYVHTEIVWINDTAIKVIKKADNECAFEVIKLHAELVKGFFETGRLALQQDHAPPEEVYQICQPYLEANTTTTTNTTVATNTTG